MRVLCESTDCGMPVESLTSMAPESRVLKKFTTYQEGLGIQIQYFHDFTAVNYTLAQPRDGIIGQTRRSCRRRP